MANSYLELEYGCNLYECFSSHDIQFANSVVSTTSVIFTIVILVVHFLCARGMERRERRGVDAQAIFVTTIPRCAEIRSCVCGFFFLLRQPALRTASSASAFPSLIFCCSPSIDSFGQEASRFTLPSRPGLSAMAGVPEAASQAVETTTEPDETPGEHGFF